MKIDIYSFFHYVALFCLMVGLAQAFYVLSKNFHAGKRFGAVLVAFIKVFGWSASALAVYFLGFELFNLAWKNPDVMALLVALVISISVFMLANRLLGIVFLGRKNGTNFNKLIPRFSEDQRRLIAAHEAGHLLLHASVDHSCLPKLEAKITRGFSGVAGYVVSFSSAVSADLPSASFLHWEAMMVLAGDQATEVLLGERYLGAESDMQRWWHLAHRILIGGLGVAAWPQGNFKEINNLRISVLEMQLKAHRKNIYDFLSANKNLLMSIAVRLERSGRLSNAECRAFLKQATHTHILPIINKKDVQHHRRISKIK